MLSDNIKDRENQIENQNGFQRDIYESDDRHSESAQRQEVDNLMRKLEVLCRAFQDQHEGTKESGVDQILSIAEFVHQEYTELVKQNEGLQTQVDDMAAQHERLVPLLAELEEQDSAQETKIQTLHAEIADKDGTIKGLQQALQDLKVTNKELVALSKNKKAAPQKQVVLLQTDGRLARKEQQHQKAMQAVEESKASLEEKLAAQSDEIARLSDLLSSKQDDLKTYASHVENLLTRLDFKDQQINHLGAKVKQLNEEIEFRAQELQQYELRMEQILKMQNEQDENISNDPSQHVNELLSRNDLRSFIEQQKHRRSSHFMSKNFDQMTCRYSEYHKNQEDQQSVQDVCVQSIDDSKSMVSKYSKLKKLASISRNVSQDMIIDEQNQSQELVDYEISPESPLGGRKIRLNQTPNRKSGDVMLLKPPLGRTKVKDRQSSLNNLLNRNQDLPEPLKMSILELAENQEEEEDNIISDYSMTEEGHSSKSGSQKNKQEEIYLGGTFGLNVQKEIQRRFTESQRRSTDWQMEEVQIETIDDKKDEKSEEKVFFEMLVKSIIHNQPHELYADIEKNIDAEKMYERAQDQKVEFYQYIEWVEHDIRMQIFKGLDALFEQADKRFRKQLLEDSDNSQQFQGFVITKHNKNQIKFEDPRKKKMSKEKSKFGMICCSDQRFKNEDNPEVFSTLKPRSQNNLASARGNKKLDDSMDFTKKQFSNNLKKLSSQKILL